MDLWLQNSSLPSATDILLVIATFFVLQPQNLIQQLEAQTVTNLYTPCTTKE